MIQVQVGLSLWLCLSYGLFFPMVGFLPMVFTSMYGFLSLRVQRMSGFVFALLVYI
jgi:hypothetical protein